MARVFVITGPSGVGKGTLIRTLRERLPDLELSVSATTRAPRPGERDGVEYHFLDDADFQRRVDAGEFYDGDKQSYSVGAAVRLNGRLNASITESRNQIRLQAGQYTTDLITARLEYGFSTIAFANALLQYNTDAREWSSNLRFNIIHHPLSDFFLVFNERRDSTTGGLIDRALVAKMTYMVAF